MPIIDSQIHAYERNHPGRPWLNVPNWPPEVNGDQMVAAMDEVGVDGAVFISPFTMYGYDASYALEVYRKHPGRFCLIKPVDPADPAVGETITDWAAQDGTVAVRIMVDRIKISDGADEGVARVCRAAAKHNLPLNLLAWGRLDLAHAIAANNPDTVIIIDHLGIVQPHEPPAPKDPWGDLPRVEKLAQLKNVRIKISGACTLSHEPFPYNDIWDPLARIFDAYGLERCMWGTDWTRTAALLTYREGVEPFRLTDRLSQSDKAVLMGGALTKIYNWSPKKA